MPRSVISKPTSVRFTPCGLRFFQRGAADELGLLHLAEAVEAGFPDINRIGNFVAVEREFAFEAQRVARAQAAGDERRIPCPLQNFIPDRALVASSAGT
jgi:hypothetical protein